MLIWDGFGLSKRQAGNAVSNAKMPHWHELTSNYPFSYLHADGRYVGLPAGEVGNSEAGHAAIGAGRVVLTDKILINEAIQKKEFQNNPAFLRAAAHVIRNNSTLHLMGLLTNHQSGHGSIVHLKALLDFVIKLKLPRVALHLFTDGRDTAPFHALKLLSEVEAKLTPQIKIVSVTGRFYAMDRDRNWARTAAAYNCITRAQGLTATTPALAIEQAYARGETDEFILPTIICGQDGKEAVTINDHDAVIFWNLRSDRARQLTKPFVQSKFEGERIFKNRKKYRDLCFVTMTEFGKRIDGAFSAYPHHEVPGTMVEALRTMRQVYISESEKFSQITYFMNGGFDVPRFGEERVRIPSVHTASFASCPAMRAPQVADQIVKCVLDSHDFICANFANADMVAHTGDYKATIKACEALDSSLGVVWKAVKRKSGILIVTSDHGNAEEVITAHGGMDTQHNANPVPFLVAEPGLHGKRARNGSLTGIAPTILELLGVPKPKEMSGTALL